ncbi:UNVERIFIED_CONTAM: hypothetical protein Sradi_2009700 [Sesamum radiatum]|uniref:Uncharacterized protein n=1 Tax=Sesamum radiatum TaxID=300843 RepID=A0AAW2TGC8_SESRA
MMLLAHFFSVHLNPEPVGACSSFPTDGTEADPSSYSYDVSRLSDRCFDVVRAADQPSYNGCDESQLSAVAQLVNIKAENNMSERCYDHATNQAFMMRAALMWTINDLPAYGMASGWSTADIMGCPVCMEDIQAFRLQHGRNACYFDCHRQFLPHDHPYRRNKEILHKNRQERKIARRG